MGQTVGELGDDRTDRGGDRSPGSLVGDPFFRGQLGQLVGCPNTLLECRNRPLGSCFGRVEVLRTGIGFFADKLGGITQE